MLHDVQLVLSVLEEHIRGKDKFPRRYASENFLYGRQIVESYSDYLKLYYHALSFELDFHTSVYDEKSIVDGMIDTIFIEIDGTPEILEDNLEIVKSISQVYDCRTYFSGNKGFHVFIDLPFAFPISIFSKTELIKYLSGFGIQTENKEKAGFYDGTHILQIKSMSRVPFSINPKSKMYMIPIKPTWNIQEVKSFSKTLKYDYEITPRNLDKNLSIVKAIKRTDKVVNEFDKKEIPSESLIESYKWIDKLLTKGVEDGRHRLLWLVIAPYLVNVLGYSFQEAFVICSEWMRKCISVKDTNAKEKLKYYLVYVRERNLMPMSLKSLEHQYPDLYKIVSDVVNG